MTIAYVMDLKTCVPLSTCSACELLPMAYTQGEACLLLRRGRAD